MAFSKVVRSAGALLNSGTLAIHHAGPTREVCATAWQACKAKEWQHAATHMVSNAAQALQRGANQVGGVAALLLRDVPAVCSLQVAQAVVGDDNKV